VSAYTDSAGLFERLRGIRYRTLSEIRWELWSKGSGNWFVVPSGADFDVSIPRFLHWAFSPHDPRFLKAAALHDVMLQQGVDRLRAAAEFNLALKADGVGAGERLAMFLAVAVWKWR